jgi:hypothetical protein
MTTFKEIRGTTIEVVSTDPTNPELRSDLVQQF